MTMLNALSVRVRLGVVASVAVCALALSGCQGASPGGTSETTTAVVAPSATPTPTPTPAAVYKPADAQGKAQNVPVPVKPALADENSKAGLEAFVGYWYQLLSYGYETGDLSEWSALTKPGCVFCAELKDGIDTSYTKGRWLEGGTMTTPSVNATIESNGAPQKVLVQIIHSPVKYYNSDGTPGRADSAGSNSASIVLCDFVGGTWSVSDLSLVG